MLGSSTQPSEASSQGLLVGDRRERLLTISPSIQLELDDPYRSRPQSAFKEKAHGLGSSESGSCSSSVTEESYACEIPNLQSHAPGRSLFMIDDHCASSISLGLHEFQSAAECQLTESNIGIFPIDDDKKTFGKSLEEAYNVSCAVLGEIIPVDAEPSLPTQLMDIKLAVEATQEALKRMDVGLRLLAFRVDSQLRMALSNIDAQDNGSLEPMSLSNATIPAPHANGEAKDSNVSAPTLAAVEGLSPENRLGERLSSIAVFRTASYKDETCPSSPQESMRSRSSSSVSSRHSIVTALNCALDSIPSEQTDTQECDSEISGHDSPGRYSTQLCDLPSGAGEVSPSTADIQGHIPLSTPPVGQKRSSSGSTTSTGLSIVTTFSKASTSSKTSIFSGSSSGSSGHAVSPFGRLDPKTKKWNPQVTKSQPSIGIDKEVDGPDVNHLSNIMQTKRMVVRKKAKTPFQRPEVVP